MYNVTFVSSNRHKFEEVRRILERLGVRVRYHAASLPEMQSESLFQIARLKASAARKLTGGAVLVEDDGLFVDCLNGFPGPYSAYVFDTIGNGGILSLVGESRGATFRSAMAYDDGSTQKQFGGEVRGRISERPAGRGWGYDPIFAPDGAGGTLAQVDKDAFSHRRVALEAFAAWLNARP